MTGAHWTTTEGENVTVTKTCCVCHKEASITVDRTKYDRWIAGEHAQNVFRDLSADDREILISGTHPECWNELFGKVD